MASDGGPRPIDQVAALDVEIKPKRGKTRSARVAGEQLLWTYVKNRDEIEAFYRAILPKIREAARSEGYAIGVHGSLRRDLDLIATPWVEQYSDKEKLARAIHRAACGLESESYQWEQKPNGRMAASFPICFIDWHNWTDPGNPDAPSLGHIDLSVVAREGDVK